MGKVGLYVGRFQPFHLGHLEAIKYILSKVDELVIVIGSSQYSHTSENPFTAGERVRMIRLALTEAEIDPSKYMTIPISDTGSHGVWVSYVLMRTPKFEVVYSNEPVTSRLFDEAGFKVEGIPFFNRDFYSATFIRSRMLNDQDWEKFVPRSVVEYIKEIEGVRRIKDIAGTDKPS